MQVFKAEEEVEGGYDVTVDFIRAYSMVLVLLLHSSNEYYKCVMETPIDSEWSWWVATFYKSLSLPCVPLFVILSGSLLLQNSKVNEPIKLFFRKRFSRIVPAFIFWSFIYLAWAFFTSKAPITIENIFNGLMYSFFTGAYYHFWFIYMIIGLYMLTPILRVLVASNNQKILEYTLILWFINVSIFPLIEFITGYSLHDSLFVLCGFVGYYILGVYLRGVSPNRLMLYGLYAISLMSTIVGTWILTFYYPIEGYTYLFFDYLSMNVVVESTTLFIILSKLTSFKSRLSRVYPVIRLIGGNTLPIYFLHVIVMETIQRGYLGVKISITEINPLLGIPLVAATTILATLGIILILKRIPFIRNLIG